MKDATIQAIGAEAVRDYPNECCGLVIAGLAGERVVSIANIYDRLRALYPDDYPRTARTAYEMDAATLHRTLEGLAPGEKLTVIYHSHCDAGAYFSEEDARAALGGGAVPLFDCDYFVLSIRGGQIAGGRNFRWNGAGFAEVGPV